MYYSWREYTLSSHLCTKLYCQTTICNVPNWQKLARTCICCYVRQASSNRISHTQKNKTKTKNKKRFAYSKELGRRYCLFSFWPPTSMDRACAEWLTKCPLAGFSYFWKSLSSLHSMQIPGINIRPLALQGNKAVYGTFASCEGSRKTDCSNALFLWIKSTLDTPEMARRWKSEAGALSLTYLNRRAARLTQWLCLGTTISFVCTFFVSIFIVG